MMQELLLPRWHLAGGWGWDFKHGLPMGTQWLIPIFRRNLLDVHLNRSCWIHLIHRDSPSNFPATCGHESVQIGCKSLTIHPNSIGETTMSVIALIHSSNPSASGCHLPCAHWRLKWRWEVWFAGASHACSEATWPHHAMGAWCIPPILCLLNDMGVWEILEDGKMMRNDEKWWSTLLDVWIQNTVHGPSQGEPWWAQFYENGACRTSQDTSDRFVMFVWKWSTPEIRCFVIIITYNPLLISFD